MLGSPKPLAVAVLAALYVVSMLGRYDIGLSIADWFALERWYQFFLGTLTYWLTAGQVRGRTLVASWGVLGLVLTISGDGIGAVPIATSALLWWSHRRDGMQTMLSGAAWQFLVAVSYSLYLFHLIFGWRFIRAVGLVTGPDVPASVAVVVYISGCAVSIVGAWVMWRIVERPSIKLSRAVGLKPHPSSTVVAAEAT
jgi:peptidoglycan/LPS O-acetylase OafA/YrhL